MRVGLIALIVASVLGAVLNTLLWAGLAYVGATRDRPFHDQGGMLITFGMMLTAGVWAVTALPCFIVGISAAGGGEADRTRRLGQVAVGLAVLAVVIPIVLALVAFVLSG
jgi:hypothetical protein